MPENTLKFAVGVLLTTFGTFWGAEGAGGDWPGGDAALGGPRFVIAMAAIQVRVLKARAAAPSRRRTRDRGRERLMRYVVAFLRFWYDFIVGDDWRIAVGIVIALALAALLADQGIAAWWVIPTAVAALLSASLWRVARKG